MAIPRLSALAIVFTLTPLVSSAEGDSTKSPTKHNHSTPNPDELPNRPIRYMTLAEAISIALEQGDRRQTVSTPIITGGLQNYTNGGRAAFVVADDLGIPNRRCFTGDDACRVFVLDWAIIADGIRATLPKFERWWNLSMVWKKIDTASSGIPPITYASEPIMDPFSICFYKPLLNGGFATDSVDPYSSRFAQNCRGFAVISPRYQPSLNFGFEPSLLSDYGIEINNLLAQYPIISDQLSPFGERSQGILIQRLRYEQSRPEFERDINVMLFNVEYNYWVLYANYLALYAHEQGLRKAYDIWHIAKAQHDAGKLNDGELERVRAAIAQFRNQRIDSVQYVVESERQLRSVLGLKAENNRRIVPADIPTKAPYMPDYASSVNETLSNRPELVMARQEVRANQLKVKMREKIEGSDAPVDSPEKTVSELNTFNNVGRWSFGGHGPSTTLRADRLNLARSFVTLKNQELKAERFLAAVYQNMYRYCHDIEAYREQRKALADQLSGLYARLPEAKDPLIVLATAEIQFAQALANEYAAIANYNITLAGLAYAKGTIQRYNSVIITDRSLHPKDTFARAREHYKQQGKRVVADKQASSPDWDKPTSLTILLDNVLPAPIKFAE